MGITSSPAFVREPEGNGCAERFIRTLKENLLWLKTFDTVEELRLALHEFQRQYNETWLIGRHGYKAPAQVSIRPKVFWHNIYPVYDVIQTFVYDATPNDKVPNVRYVPLLDSPA